MSTALNPRRLLAGGLAAGVWVFVSGLLMAAAFGFREMQAAFDAIGFAPSLGAAAFGTHTLVRFVLGFAVVGLVVVMTRVFPPTRAVPAAAALAWLLASFLPMLVMTEWGLFPWSLAWKTWAWSAGEFLVAALLGWSICRPRDLAVPH